MFNCDCQPDELLWYGRSTNQIACFSHAPLCMHNRNRKCPTAHAQPEVHLRSMYGEVKCPLFTTTTKCTYEACMGGQMPTIHYYLNSGHLTPHTCFIGALPVPVANAQCGISGSVSGCAYAVEYERNKQSDWLMTSHHVTKCCNLIG